MNRFTTKFPPAMQPLLWVTAGLVFAIVPHLAALPLWVTLLTGLAISWRLLIEAQRRPLPPSLLRTAIAFGAMSGVLFTYRTLNGLEAGTAFLALMAGMKLLETRTARDLTIIVFACYFLLFAGFLYNQELLRLPYMLLAAWLLTATLMRINQRAPMSVREAVGLTGKMALQALPLAALLFFFFPRLPGQFWALPARNNATTGLSDTMSPGDVSDLSVSGDIAFRAKFDGSLPPPAERYWRGPVLQEFDGRTWRISQFPLPEQTMNVLGGEYSYRVTLEPHHRNWVFALDLVTQWPQPQTRRTYDYQLFSRRPIATLSSYSMKSATAYVTSGPLARSTRSASLRLPQDRNPRTKAFAAQLRSRHGADDTAIIQTVLAKFRDEEYFYTLEPPRLAADSVDDFLFNTRRGFCEHFASAFTVLVRAAGIPARVVTGYQGGELNPMGGYMIVRQSDAHAWSEVWLEERGWVRIDPTAAVSPERIEGGLDAAMGEEEPVPGRLLRRSSVLTQVRLIWDAANTFWNDQIVEFGESQQRSILQRLGIEDADWQDLAVGLVVTLALFFLVLTVYLAWQFQPRARDPVAQVYVQLCRKLARQKLPRLSHEGPNDYLNRVAAVRPELTDAIEEVRKIYISLRYGPSPLSTQLSRLKFLVNQLKV